MSAEWAGSFLLAPMTHGTFLRALSSLLTFESSADLSPLSLSARGQGPGLTQPHTPPPPGRVPGIEQPVKYLLNYTSLCPPPCT